MTELIEAVARAIRDSDAWRTWKSEQAHTDSAQAALTAITDAGYRIVSGWQPIETAPKDRSYVLVKMRDDAFKGSQFEHYAGRYFVARREGLTNSGYDMGWSLFPGFGGVVDCEIEAWFPLPAAPGDEK